ncbi:TOBE domain-containing protein (plasmid) [Paracoccus sp. SMMA_5_TC]|nr:MULTISPECIES: TOBE domain-containing protein [unclassified Paracoccus (in: a-proteobacteria)]UXU76668.1 TOBE domain-containing protein [Paracoccus sp. SMMA_5]UXU82558.1 TOBE domain-containing protein [Paracoccus sp. SMMA_5_TC]
MNRFVADFVGETNFLPVEVLAAHPGQATVRTPFGQVMRVPAPAGIVTGQATLSVRPEKVNLGDQAPVGAFQATVVNKNYMGGYTHYLLSAHGVELRGSRRNASRDGDAIQVGSTVPAGFSEISARVLAA